MQLETIDQQISAFKEEIARLEAERAYARQTEAALNGIKPLLTDYCAQHSLQLSDLFQVMEKDIERWIKSQRAQPEGIHQHLKSYFARIISEGDNVPSARQAKPEPKIAAGLYTNPYTQEQVIKKTRAPKELREWIQVYG
ncbi:MAG: hypothetical protein WED11_07265, partial [Natronospirillum sp.]